MKYCYYIFVVCICFYVSEAQSFYGSTVEKIFRDGRNKEMCDQKETPLKTEDYLGFKELVYFDSNPKFRVEAAFRASADEKIFNFQTSSAKVKKFAKKGTLIFRIDKIDHRLSVFQSVGLPETDEFFDLWFIPFKDLSNGKTTYGGGRYLSIWKPKDGKVILDFNMAYNPSCAFGSDRFSCPIPPKENFLRVEILAGEKKYVSLGRKAHE
jgi:uncharacterized protein